ncbi:MAG TPA: DUF547 domain-containing protein [Nitrospira sp.]|nr:DUF547 domain-containing protein [Nitrospira sp.]
MPFLDPQRGKATNDLAVWACALLLTGSVGGGCSTVPERFVPADPIDPAHVSHQMLSDVLRAAVHDGQVNYPAVQMDHRFAAYLAQIDRVDPLLGSRDDRLAFWINAYNACAIQGILDGYSPEPYLGWYRFFKSHTYRIGGSPLNLSDVEHEILRKQFREPRIHFAIVCASSSCPKLASRAYEGQELDRQLDEAARAFINDPSRNRFDKQTRTAYLSKIFDWFEEDFAASAGSVVQFVAQYVHERELSHDLAAGLYEIKYLKYDWRLNGPPPKEAAHAGAR